MILTCLPVECRVLAGMITDRDILALCDDVESSDFVEMRHVTVLYGIRAVQERGERICAESVADAVQQLALDWGAVAMAETPEQYATLNRLDTLIWEGHEH